MPLFRNVYLLSPGGTFWCGDMIALWPLRLLWPFSDYDYVVLTVVVVATGLSETDSLQHRAPWIIAGAGLLLMGYFLFIPGWGAA